MSSYDGWLHERDAKKVMKVATILAVLIIPLALLSIDFLWVSAGLFCGATMGYWVTPDIDHKGTTREEYRAMKKGKFFGALWIAYMTPYAYLFPHRSFWSHSTVGTLVRMLYIFAPVAFIIWLLFKDSNLDIDVNITPFITSFMLAWIIQDCFHYKRDRIGFFGFKGRIWKWLKT